MNVMEYLDASESTYEIKRHRPVFTAQQMAQEEHIHGMNVAKPVIVKGDGVYYMCVLPACCKVNFDALKSVLEASEVYLVDEKELAGLFPGCQIGAEPPFGSLYGLPTIMDDRLRADEFIVFQDGSHDEAIRLELSEYLRIECPRIYAFSKHL
jgi:Ala-tRNA(Pro) deacylase